MKRKILILLVVSLAIVAAGWLTPKLVTHNRKEVLLLGAIIVISGLLLSNLLAFLVFKLLHVKRSFLSRLNRWAVNLAITFAGFAFAMALNAIVTKPLSKLLLGVVSQRVFYNLDGFIDFFFFFFLLLSIFYVLLRLYEETLAKRAKRFSRPSFLQGGWKLPLKLMFGGLIVFLLTRFISAGDWVKETEYFFDRPGYGWGEVNDSIGIVFVYSEGKSHDWYFNMVYKLSSELREIGARTALVPLPPRLAPIQSNVKSLQKIARLGLVVFAVPPEEKAEYPELWVRHPVNNLTEFEWGVVSVQRLPSLTWSSHRFYPNAFKEVGRGYSVPDAAVRLVQNFFGLAKEIPGGNSSKRFQIGKFSMGLHADQSAPVFSTLKFLTIPNVTISLDEKKNVLEWHGSKAEARSRFKGGIVVVDPGETITSFFQFGFTYSQIIHQIVKGRNVTPLDLWTPAFVSMFILIAIALFWLYNPWIASLAVFFITVGQGFLYSWMNSQFGLMVEAVPLFITGTLSIPMLVFVRINHERSFLHVVEKQRALQELQTAHDMQLGLMPTADPIMPGFDISGLTKPADEVGGDFFDYVWLDEAKTRLGIAVADVSGKAMKAAMTAVLASGMVYRELGSKDTPKSILTKINKPLHLKTDKRIFIAMTFALINRKTKTFSYSNAGQMLPMLKRNGELRYLKVPGPRLPLGVREDIAYEEASLKLKRGDVVVLFSDGIPEAMNEKRDLYGFERFESMVSSLPTELSAQELSREIIARVSEFTQDSPQHDDMTVVVVKVQ